MRDYITRYESWQVSQFETEVLCLDSLFWEYWISLLVVDIVIVIAGKFLMDRPITSELVVWFLSRHENIDGGGPGEYL